jgi:hypothetical protein
MCENTHPSPIPAASPVICCSVQVEIVDCGELPADDTDVVDSIVEENKQLAFTRSTGVGI